MEERNAKIETLRTLESVEAKVKRHHDKAQMHKLSMSQKFSSHCERIKNQGIRHKELQETRELERAGELLDRLNQRKKALEKYEKAKRKASMAIEERNSEKLDMTAKCAEKRREDTIQLARQMRQKEAKVRRKM